MKLFRGVSRKIDNLYIDKFFFNYIEKGLPLWAKTVPEGILKCIDSKMKKLDIREEYWSCGNLMGGLVFAEQCDETVGFLLEAVCL